MSTQTSHAAQVPSLIAEYFAAYHPGVSDHPVITQQFTPGRGWARQDFRKRASVSWLRKLKAEGVTSVQVSAGGYSPDFTVDEVIRHASRPLLGGRVI
jgi:hypothetical protein